MWTIADHDPGSAGASAGRATPGACSSAGSPLVGRVRPGERVHPDDVPVWSPYIRGERVTVPRSRPAGRAHGLDLTHGAGGGAAGRLRGVRLRRPPAHRPGGAPVSRIVADRWRYPGPGLDAGHGRLHRPARAGVRRARRRGAGRGVAGPDGGGCGVGAHRRRPMGCRRAGGRTEPGLGRPGGRNATAGSSNWRRYGSSAATYLISPNATIEGASGNSKPLAAYSSGVVCTVVCQPRAARYSAASLRSPSYTRSAQFTFSPSRRQRSLISLPRLAIRSRMSGT